jgi:NlpC/P60 family putative phage cell wall peptidase
VTRRPRRRKPASADPDKVIAAARAWLGTPYHDQASLRGVGCDCLGLARGVWRDVIGDEPVVIPPYSRDWGEAGAREVLLEGATEALIGVPITEVAPGDLLLFRMRRDAIAKHIGILTTPDTFIHAYDRLGVVEEHLSDFWRRRIACAFRFPRPKRRPRARRTATAGLSLNPTSKV